MFSCEFCYISKNIIFHRTPLVAVSASLNNCETVLIEFSKTQQTNRRKQEFRDAYDQYK